MQKTFSAAKSICESSLIQREIVSGQSIQQLHVSKSVTKSFVSCEDQTK